MMTANVKQAKCYRCTQKNTARDVQSSLLLLTCDVSKRQKPVINKTRALDEHKVQSLSYCPTFDLANALYCCVVLGSVSGDASQSESRNDGDEHRRAMIGQCGHAFLCDWLEYVFTFTKGGSWSGRF